MIIPAIGTMVVDRISGDLGWVAFTGFLAVPLVMDVALLPVANPRLLESAYLGIAGAVSASICFGLLRRFKARL